MKYTIVLTEKPEGGIHVSVPAFPDCHLDAVTRDDAIRLASEALAAFVSRSEIVDIDIPQQLKTTHPPDTTPWEWFGAAQNDATWGLFFDEIEHRREVSSEG